MSSHDLSCCQRCHELKTEAGGAADVVHNAWLETWDMCVNRPPPEDEVKEDFLKCIECYFKNNREGWVDDYKRVALAFVLTNGVAEEEEVVAGWRSAVMGGDIRATIYFKQLVWLVRDLSYGGESWTDDEEWVEEYHDEYDTSAWGGDCE